MNRCIISFLFCCVNTISYSQTDKSVDKDYLMGKFNPQTDSRFSPLKSEHAPAGGALRTEAYLAFVKMAYAANKEKVKLIIISGTRNFSAQKRIWEGKWTGSTKVGGKDLTTVTNPVDRAKIILRYSSMPGSSRHHWGTDVDLNSFENGYFETGEGLRIYKWLQTHAVEYGFCQPYTSKKDGRTGYEEEKWHWSYLPLSKGFLEQYIQQIQYSDIKGFEGSDTAPAIKIIGEYVEGVSCK
jgi:D-alanyl-D-alanine carboxypeptidase